MIDIYDIAEKLDLEFEKIINIYKYGSHIYDTNNKFSDNDYIIVYRQISYKFELHDKHPDIQATLYNIQGFQQDLDKMNLTCLECIFLNDNDKIEKHQFTYNKNLQLLRESVSSKVSNSFVICKKKLRDLDVYVGQKYLFHCLRMVYFGKQVAFYNKIVDYKGVDFDPRYKDFRELLNEIVSEDDWLVLKERYQKMLNNHLSDFRLLAGKVKNNF